MTAIEATPTNPTRFGLFQMEDRKRPSPYDQQDLGPPTKKVAMNANGAIKKERDTDMPWQNDLEVGVETARLNQA